LGKSKNHKINNKIIERDMEDIIKSLKIVERNIEYMKN